jgi:hypothetical protein
MDSPFSCIRNSGLSVHWCIPLIGTISSLGILRSLTALLFHLVHGSIPLISNRCRLTQLGRVRSAFTFWDPYAISSPSIGLRSVCPILSVHGSIPRLLVFSGSGFRSVPADTRKRFFLRLCALSFHRSIPFLFQLSDGRNT